MARGVCLTKHGVSSDKEARAKADSLPLGFQRFSHDFNEWKRGDNQ